jgi:hypothetical protein
MLYGLTADPRARTRTAGRKSRQVKVYKKPHTCEVVETKCDNQKALADQSFMTIELRV